MAASADPSGNQGGGGGGGRGDAAAGNPSNGSTVAAAGNPGPAEGLQHDPGLSDEWSAEEQALLEELLTKYASVPVVARYAKIAKQLQDKTVRDVALRCRWMTKKESGKRRKDDLARKSKDKKDRVADPSAKPPAHLAARPIVPPYALQVLHLDNDDEISYKEIGGVTGQLLEHNAQVFSQISANLANYQVHENISLFCQTRDNIHKILNDMNDMPEIMKQMPPLPPVNEDLSSSILPRTTLPTQT